MPAQKRSLTLISLVIALVFTTVPAAVATPSEEELQRQIDSASATQEALQDDLGGAQAELNELEADFQLAVDDYNLVSEELQALEVDIARQEDEVEHYRTQTASARSRVGRSARSLYIGGLKGGLPGLIGGEASSDLSRRLVLIEAARTSRLQALEAYAGDQQRYESSLNLLKAAREEADAVRAELATLQGEIEEKVDSQRDDIARLESEISRQAALRAEREERLAAVRAERARQEAADRAAREQAEKEAAEKAARERAEAERKKAEAASSKAAVAVKTALAQVGKPYRWAGSGPNSFDCSGLTSYAWRAAGVSLPHNSGMQYNATTRVSMSDLQPGDLLFFYSPISHVGMYIGDGKMVEAPYTGKNVRVRSINRGGLVGAGRPRY